MIIAVMVATAMLAVGGTTWLLGTEATPPIRNTVALSWGDHTRGSLTKYYGAHVYVRPASGAYEVLFTVYIGRPDRYFAYQQTPIVLGTASTWEEAAERYGTIRWTATDVVGRQRQFVRLQARSQTD